MNKSHSFTRKIQRVGTTLFLGALTMVSWDMCALSEIVSGSVIGQARTAPPAESQPAAAQGRESGPASLLEMHPNRLPELQTWATNWQTQTTVDLKHLANWIAMSDLSALECLQIGGMIAHDEGYPAGKVWIAAGCQRVLYRQANRDRNGKSPDPIVSTMVSAENRLHGRADAATLLEQLTSLIIRFAPTNKWDQTSKWARIHHADALLLEGRNVVANLEVGAMSREAQTNPHWDSKLKIELRLLNARIPFEPEADSPLDILNLHRPQPKELLAWLVARKAAHANDQTDEGDAAFAINRSSLLGLIEKSDLSALECLRISELLADGSDQLDAEVFASVGTDRAISTLNNIPIDDLRCRPILNAFKRVEQRLWESPASEIDRGVTLEKINCILIRFARENPWDQTPEWARIGHGEALYMQHQYSAALADANQIAIDSTRDDHFTRVQKVAINWLQALVLFDTYRYKEAVPHLEATATSADFGHSKDAWPMWAVALAKSGDSEHANRVFDDWIRQSRPPMDTAAHVLATIQGQ
jgi:tetratricopeptide (TPR) repeat protein